MVLQALCDFTPAFFIEPLFCPLLSWQSEFQCKLLVHPWTPCTSISLDPCLCCALYLKRLSHPVCLAKCWSSFRFHLGHHLPKDTFPAAQVDPGPLLSDSPLPCASLWHGTIRPSCHGLSTSLPFLFPPSLWMDRGRFSMKLRML